MKIGIVIPARDEEETVGQVVQRCRLLVSWTDEIRIVVCDNGSIDGTRTEADKAGAEVVYASKFGYGLACLTAVGELGNWPDVLLFIDADGSSRPQEIQDLLVPIKEGRADLVLVWRSSSVHMTFPQRWGTWLATRLIAWRWWGHSFQDIGPFRAITRHGYSRLGMKDRTWGWTVEMQVLALIRRLRIQEVPVSWDRRVAGVSKISGTFSGVIRAGARTLWTIGCYASFSRDSTTPGTPGEDVSG